MGVEVGGEKEKGKVGKGRKGKDSRKGTDGVSGVEVRGEKEKGKRGNERTAGEALIVSI